MSTEFEAAFSSCCGLDLGFGFDLGLCIGFSSALFSLATSKLEAGFRKSLTRIMLSAGKQQNISKVDMQNIARFPAQHAHGRISLSHRRGCTRDSQEVNNFLVMQLVSMCTAEFDVN